MPIPSKHCNSKATGPRRLALLQRMNGSKILWRWKHSRNFIGKKKYKVHDYYFLGPELGRGSFGVATECADKDTLKKFACKSISKNGAHFYMENVQQEVAIMEHLPPHPNIIALKGAFDDDHAVHLVMELCEGGDLTSRIDTRDHYTERGAAAVIHTVVEAVQMCHKHGVMHGDLKPENFLFANADENSPLKIIDFGLSVLFKPGDSFSDVVGTHLYMAPEIYCGNYGPEVDMWSAGVILYLLLSGEFPFDGETEHEIKQKVMYGALDLSSGAWQKVSRSAKALVRHMLDRNQNARYTAEQVLSHPWLRSNYCTQLECHVNTCKYAKLRAKPHTIRCEISLL